MNQPAPLLRSPLWADLDALVIEEMNALDQPFGDPVEPLNFASDEDFLARASLFLRGHPRAEGLVERLCGDLRLFRRDETPEPQVQAAAATPASESEPAVEPPVETDRAP